MNDMPYHINTMKEILHHLDEAQKILNKGPLDYYFKKLIEHSEALLTKFSPIKIGDKAIIVKKIDCSGGWKNCEKTLQIGSIGKVEDVDYSDGEFKYTFVPDYQWIEKDNGNYTLLNRKYSYLLKESELARFGEPN